MMNFGAGARAFHSTLLLALLVLCGCAGTKPPADGFPRSFVFTQDTLSFSNELYWVYHTDPVTGKTTHERREPKPTYAQHCFVVAKAARLFFQHAHFDAAAPRTNETGYRELVRQVEDRSARVERPPAERIVIPGYANLREFSAAYEQVLKDECGSKRACYLQRGNWRMIFHFSKQGQEKMAKQLLASIRRNRPPIVHVADFPKLHINHALMLFDASEDEKEIEFAVYDPNDPSNPERLLFDRKARRFFFPKNFYFAGGQVDVYEVYCAWNY